MSGRKKTAVAKATKAEAVKKPLVTKKKTPTPAERSPAAAKRKATPPSKRAAPTKKAVPPNKAASKTKSAAPAKKANTKKAAAPAKKPRAKKAAVKEPVTGKRGLKGQAKPDASSRVGTVDPAANLSGDAVLAQEDGGDELDCMLTQIDVSQNMDKYFILQVITAPPNPSTKKARTGTGNKAAAANTEQFYFFTRWGRTGRSGSCMVEGPFDDVQEATALFNAKFKEKTGNDWDVDNREDRYVSNAGKYTCLRPNKTQVKSEAWQYWVDDKVDGKVDGWYDYDDSAAAVVEQLYTEFQTNQSLSLRVVASGEFFYHVDLSQMTQINISHPGHKIRRIRRNPGRSLPNTPRFGKVKKGKGKAAARVSAAAAATTPAAAISTAEVDKACPKAGSKGVSVCAGHDVKLNQTNISANNNKFYILQMCRDAGRNNWFVWCRWGRVGEAGATAELGPFSSEADASTAFAKKFRDKTGNKWEDAQKGKFEAFTGKYELIETDNSDTSISVAVVANAGSVSSGRPAKILPCTLDSATKELVEMIFSADMFKSAMTSMNVDVKKMPLGQLSKAQVQRGYSVLEELEEALKNTAVSNRADLLEELSARFYQVIPHAFGRQRPPVINTDDMLHSKVEMLNVLQDIGEAQSMLSSTDSAKGKGKNGNGAAPPAVPHPTDVNYGLLNADLKPVHPKSKEHEVIKSYLENTNAGGFIYDVWSVDRKGEAQRFGEHDEITNRKLLWHGTNVAVVAAIVKSGLRIMPHSGGRVGRGIYLASENAKSRAYVWPAYGAKGTGNNVGVMFLCEAALGKEASITIDDSRLTEPPKGHDSVVARGRIEPDPSEDIELVMDGKKVKVPQGKPKPMPEYNSSRFMNSEYLLYKESQQRIRYMLTIKC